MLTPNSLPTTGAAVRVLAAGSFSELASVPLPAQRLPPEPEPLLREGGLRRRRYGGVAEGLLEEQQLFATDLVVMHDPAFGTPAGGSGGSGGSAGSGGADPCPGCSFVTVPAYGRHLAHDGRRNLIYMTADASAVMHPDSLVTVDAATGGVTSIVPVGSDPQPLALSDDGSVLWVGLAGEHGCGG